MLEIKRDPSIRDPAKEISGPAAALGRCFKMRVKSYFDAFTEMWRYYKVISVNASCANCVSALRFDEYPSYWFNYQNFEDDGKYFGKYSFDGIVVEDFPYLCYTEDSEIMKAVAAKMEEISLEEYNSAMNTYVMRLQALEWPTDRDCDFDKGELG